MALRPMLRIMLCRDGTLAIRLPHKGARWQRKLPDLDAAVKRAIDSGLQLPFTLRFVTAENEE